MTSMMDLDREERERAIREADRLLAECERDEWQRAKRQKRSAPAEIVCKTYEPRPTPQPQQSAIAMDPEKERQWNDWFDAGIKNYLKQNNKAMAEATRDAVVEFVCTYVGQRLAAETAKLREEIAGLRSDIEILHAHKAAKSDVRDVTPITRGRHVA